jgi:poly(A) polymerase
VGNSNAQAEILLKNSGNQETAGPTIIPRAAHGISRANISKNALKVLYRLHNAGYQAFLVGGSVRDLLLGLHPKDFDVATDAHPEEINALFSNCRLIGRRFRLAHVRFGREIIEVATFRAAARHDDEHADLAHDDEGRLLRDNVYGTIAEDVWRRDFTCNALYYNIADFSVWDYVGGVDHINAKQIRLLGEAEQRLREDPVRMLRAVRFAAKLGFEIDPEIVHKIHELGILISNVPSARLFDEFIKLFQSGHAEETFVLMWRYHLFRELFPETEEALEDSEAFGRFVHAALQNTDRRVRENQSVSPMFLIGVFFWEPVKRIAADLRAEKNMGEAQALAIAAGELTLVHQARVAIPRRFSAPMREMLALQPRFNQTKGKRARSLLEHKRFRAAYDFMLLRAEVGEVEADLARFWTDIQTRGADERAKMLDVGGNGRPGGRKRKPRRRPRGQHNAS